MLSFYEYMSKEKIKELSLCVYLCCCFDFSVLKMKFRFCGDGDCPDWVLAEIHSNLSMLSSIKLKLLTLMVAKSIYGEDIKEEKLKDLFSSIPDKNNHKSAVASLRFLIVSTVQHNAAVEIFRAELEQLGLPKEHSTAVGRVVFEHSDKIRDFLSQQSLSINKLEDCKLTTSDNIDCCQLDLKINSKSQIVNISRSDIPVLLKELKTIKNMMNELNYDEKHN